MKLAAYIALWVIGYGSMALLAGEDASKDDFNRYLLISIIPLMAATLWTFYIIAMYFKGDNKRTKTDKLPPTDRQIAYIEMLCLEREVDDRMLEDEPETIEDASQLIDMLKALPRKKSIEL